VRTALIVAVAVVAPIVAGLLPWWIGAPVLLTLAALMLAFAQRMPLPGRLCGVALNVGMFGLIYAVQRDMGGSLLAWGAAMLAGLAGFSLVVLVESFARKPGLGAPAGEPREWPEIALDKVGPPAAIIELTPVAWTSDSALPGAPFADGQLPERGTGRYAISPDGNWWLAELRGGVAVFDRERGKVHRLRGWKACGWHGQPWFEQRGSDLPMSLHDVLGHR
jgi:hypothetical protein